MLLCRGFALALSVAACADCDARTDRYDLCIDGPGAEVAARSLDLAIGAALDSREWRRSRHDLGAIVRASGVTVRLYSSWVATGAPPCETEADYCAGMQARGALHLTWADAACAADTYAAHESLHLLLWLDEHPSYGAAHDERGVWCRSSRDLDCAERRAIDALDGACAVLGGVLNP